MSRDEAIEVLYDMRGEHDLLSDEEEATRYYALSWAIQEMKTLPMEQKKGRWIEMYHYHIYKCSECGRLISTTDGKNNISKHYPYCHCGAKMEGEEDGH